MGAGDGSLSAFRLRADPEGRVAASAWPEHGGPVEPVQILPEVRVRLRVRVKAQGQGQG